MYLFVKLYLGLIDNEMKLKLKPSSGCPNITHSPPFKLRQLISIPIQVTLSNNGPALSQIIKLECCFAAVLLCFDSRGCSAGPHRSIFFDFLEKSDPAMILHFLAVGAYEGECTCRPK